MTTITALPTPPSRDDPTNFASRADAFLGALPTFATQANALAGEVNTYASTATTQASTATSAASTATTQAGLANTAKLAAQAAQAAAEAVVATIPEGTINDATTSTIGVWSSSKVSSELGGKASTSATQTFTAPQRATVTSDNDLSFDLNATNNFSCTPTAGGTLTFTNIAAGQSGFILLVNGSNYAIAAHTNTKITATDLAKISATGTYVISYFSNGTNVYCVVGGAF